MAGWFWYALVAAILYGAHQIFTKLASDRISDGLGGFVVEAAAALTILLYLMYLRFSGRWNQRNQLLNPHRRVRRRRHNFLFSSLSVGRAALSSPRHPRGGRRVD